MSFEYEITADDFVAAQILYYKLSQGRRRVEGALGWILAGLFLIVVAWNEGNLNWATFLLAAIGAWWIGAAISNLLPSWWYRRGYRQAGLAGKRFKADLGKDRFEVAGDVCTWRVQWQGVDFKGENERVFILCAANTIFIFGKKYLSDDQQQELRRLTGLASLTADRQSR